eukprot:CAMPEP_0198239124 /NCGR_PEP_ID=MMETSP1446-20131203/4634_1 /TAXON_ID=1461542 ORGANISM="Unidentified sp, Strain CCMP2111" /NCGR_SAMPLE_ID=MMETSP1446 /ASSEMBLY_ACC=CAM_ASM_001112 /LENGTH=192 /DNA_ID=CAMNT_0043921675 /DNA_START=599 /DNA_END=1174 /DNA_ORIENTATION=+
MAARHRQDYDHVIKLLLIGDSGVGKSCLLLRFSENSFTTGFVSTIGIDLKIKKVMIDNKCCKMQIWDTAGQERFRTITKAYYRGAMGILLVYDTTNEVSFKNVRTWMRNIEQNSAEDVEKIIIGNKSDAEDSRVVSTSMGKALAEEFGVPFFETSAKSGNCVEEAFLHIARNIIGKLPSKSAGAPTSSTTTI